MARKSKEEKDREFLRNEIKQDLLYQLEENGTRGKHFEDLVSDYMSMWDIKNKLIDDIKLRGVAIAWANSATQQGHKKNDSVAELNKTNAQMLKILQQLNIKASSETVDDSDDF